MQLFAETILKLSPTYHRRSKCNCRIHIVVSELIIDLNISENKRVVRDALNIINYLTLTLIKTVACPDIILNA